MFAITQSCSLGHPFASLDLQLSVVFWQIKFLMMKTPWMGTDLPQPAPLHLQRPLQTHAELGWALPADLALQLWAPSLQVSQ